MIYIFKDIIFIFEQRTIDYTGNKLFRTKHSIKNVKHILNKLGKLKCMEFIPENIGNYFFLKWRLCDSDREINWSDHTRTHLRNKTSGFCIRDIFSKLYSYILYGTTKSCFTWICRSLKDFILFYNTYGCVFIKILPIFVIYLIYFCAFLNEGRL